MRTYGCYVAKVKTARPGICGFLPASRVLTGLTSGGE
jgi:hypothetical protein